MNGLHKPQSNIGFMKIVDEMNKMMVFVLKILKFSNAALSIKQLCKK